MRHLLRACGLVLLVTGVRLGAPPAGAQAVARSENRESPARGLLHGGEPTRTSPLARRVPFLAQTPRLCGGAAAAMVERYWGKLGVYAEDYADLVRPEEGGIRFSDLMQRLESRGWTATALRESPGAVGTLVEAGVPIITLVEPNPDGRHYVVVVSWGREVVAFHDPARGPDVRQSRSAFLDEWAATGYRGIVIRPDSAGGIRKSAGAEDSGGATADKAGGPGDGGSDSEEKSRAGPLGNGTPVLDLLRASRRAFDNRRYREASDLARRAASIDPTRRNAWRILAASRFLEGRSQGALFAWNRIGMPRVDLIQVRGASRTPEPLVLERLGVKNREILTPAKMRLATRRAASLPSVGRARVDYSPNVDGSVEVAVHVLERRAPWESWAGVSGVLLKGLTRGELALQVPGFLGEGEAFNVDGRWRAPRREVGIEYAAAPSFARGVLIVRGSWGRELYASPQHGAGPTPGRSREAEAWTRMSLGVRDWIRPDLEAGLRILTSRWQEGGRYVGLGVSSLALLDAAAVGLRAGAEGWMGLQGQGAFSLLDGEARWRTSPVPPRSSLSMEARAGVAVASGGTPRSLRPGAGLGVIRPYLLRAHPLAQDGAVRPERLARGIGYAGMTLLGPGWRSGPIRAVPGAFADLAAPWGIAAGSGWDLDVGFSARVSVLATGGWLELSVARGLRDGAHAVSLSWTESWWPQ